MTQFRVGRYDYAAQFDGIHSKIVEKIATLLLNGTYILSEEVSAFERNFSKLLGHTEVVGLNSGTDALILALKALNIRPGDEVVVPANTFYSTVAAVVHVGAIPKLVDADESTYLANPSRILSAITSGTRAVIVVHLYGKCLPLSSIGPVLKQKGIALIEDAAQAHGSVASDGYSPGVFSDAVCYSFHPSKNLAAAGDAGAVGTNRPEIADELRVLRNLGQVAQGNHLKVAFNSKLDAIQAIILNAKLPYLDELNAKRSDLASHYRELLGDLPLGFQQSDVGERHTYHLFQVRTRRRDALMRFLSDRGIDAVVRYPTPIHLQPAFSDLEHVRGDFPVAELLASELLALPLFPTMVMKDVEFVAKTVRDFFDSKRDGGS